LEILQSDFTVEVDEEFTIDARLTNPDLLDYRMFELYESEYLTWGFRLFDGVNYEIYTESWHTSLSETGYHSLFVECSGAVGVLTLVDQITVYVAPKQTTSGVSPLVGLAIVLTVVMALGAGCYVLIRSIHSTQPVTPTEPSTYPRLDTYAKVLVICPFCGAKTEQGITHCQHCKAPL